MVVVGSSAASDPSSPNRCTENPGLRTATPPGVPCPNRAGSSSCSPGGVTNPKYLVLRRILGSPSKVIVVWESRPLQPHQPRTMRRNLTLLTFRRSHTGRRVSWPPSPWELGLATPLLRHQASSLFEPAVDIRRPVITNCTSGVSSGAPHALRLPVPQHGSSRTTVTRLKRPLCAVDRTSTRDIESQRIG